MRVITGSARGMTLKTLDGRDVRPTTDKVKEAVFSAIQFEIEGRRVLDLFAGSGQLGIEALSRGAASATFVDSDKNAVEIIRANLDKTKLSQLAKVVRTDSLLFLQADSGTYDLAFLDPPYGTGLLQRALAAIDPRIAVGGTVVCEMPAAELLPDSVGQGLVLIKRYKYSKTAVAVYRKQV